MHIIKFGFLTHRFAGTNTNQFFEGHFFDYCLCYETNTLCHVTCSAMIEDHHGMYLVLIPHCMTEILPKECKSGNIYCLSARHCSPRLNTTHAI